MSSNDSNPTAKTPLAVAVLIITTVFWGSTLIVTKILTQSMPVLEYTCIRHALALIGFIPFFPRLWKADRRIIWWGFITGGSNFFLTVFQTYGLQTTSAGKAGFLTGLNIILVPFLVWGIFKSRPDNRIWIAISISLTGMFCLFYETGFFVFGGAEIFIIMAAFFNAIQVAYTGKYASKVDLMAFSIMQLFWLVILGFFGSLIFESGIQTVPDTGAFWGAMAYMAIFGTTIPFFFVNYGLKYVESTRGAIILALEPVFATIFGFIIGHEAITLQLVLGGSLMFLGMIIAIKSAAKQEISENKNKR